MDANLPTELKKQLTLKSFQESWRVAYERYAGLSSQYESFRRMLVKSFNELESAYNERIAYESLIKEISPDFDFEPIPELESVIWLKKDEFGPQDRRRPDELDSVEYFPQPETLEEDDNSESQIRPDDSGKKKRIRFGLREKLIEWLEYYDTALNISHIKRLADKESGADVPWSTIRNRINDLIRDGSLNKQYILDDVYYGLSGWFIDDRLTIEYLPARSARELEENTN